MIDIIAEISCNFGGDLDLAKKMIKSAAESGANYIKFQFWKTSRLKSGKWDFDGRKAFYIKSELDEKKIDILKKECSNCGVNILFSCFSCKDIDIIKNYSNEIKIPGIESDNEKMIELAVKGFDKIYFSTAATNFDICKKYSLYKKICLMHCVYAYPCPSENINIQRINDLRSLTKNVGYSGHYMGILDAIGAAFLGVKVIEKHFTIDRNLDFKDNKFSILPDEMRQLREMVNEIEKMNLHHGLNMQECEFDIKKEYSRRWDDD